VESFEVGRPAPRAASLALVLLTLALAAGSLVVLGAGRASALPVPPTARAPFAAVQYGTAGCIEVGVRPAPQFNQLPPYRVPDSYNRVAQGYPPAGYDPAALGFIAQSGTNSCLYKFYDKNPKTDPSAAVIGSGYCVQFGAGQLSGTGYDPEPPGTQSIPNYGYVLRILQDYYPATSLPAAPATSNAQKAGTVAMAIHFFTDGIVMPPVYQTAGLYNVVAGIVADAIAKGPVTTPPGDPTPTITGPDTGVTGDLVGPFTFGPADLTSPITVTVAGADAFTDAAGTSPFTSGSALPAGGRLWLRSATSTHFTITADATEVDPGGTLMIGDSSVQRVQSMLLTGAVPLLGKSAVTGAITAPPITPTLASQVSANLIEAGGTVTDTFAVGGLGTTATATLTATLYGPLPPVQGTGCLGVAWAPADSLPVARQFAPVAVTGDSSVPLDAVTLTDAGCYSFGAVIDPDGGAAVTLAPGDPAETLRVIPQIIIPPWRVTSAASTHVMDSGRSVADRIRLTGMLPGRTMTITTVLYGPVTPPANGTCTDINWTTVTAPRAAIVDSRTVDTNLTYTTRSVRPTQPGCYSFAEITTNGFVTGGEVPAEQGFGDPSELLEVRTPPSPPSPSPSPSAGRTQPAVPSTPTAGVAALPQTGVPLARPLLLAAALLAAGAALLAAGMTVQAATRRRRH
jgi:hypothetical protein